VRFLLNGLAGGNKGITREITSRGLVLGRDPGADVVINDRLVSRQHCSLSVKDGQINLKDLGSRNPTLINGIPATNAILYAGDELALGQERFLLTEIPPEQEPRSRQADGDSPTVIWNALSPFSLSVQDAHAALKERPRTLDDLLLLYEVTRELNTAKSLEELIFALSQPLKERFAPVYCCLALVREDNRLTFYQHAGQDGTPPESLIREAIKQHKGILEPRIDEKNGESTPAYTMASPMVLRDTCIAVIVVETSQPHGFYNEDDLYFLLLLAQAVSPIFFTIIQMEQLKREHSRLKKRTGESSILIGESDSMRKVRSQIDKVAPTSLSVLISGETGTGKELVAQSLHTKSNYNTGPFVVVNCAAIPRDLFESVFFGHEKGAFTGAHQKSIGLMAQAHGGTLFLDEIADLSLGSQARILRAIETNRFRPVGGKEESQVDIRILSATNKNIPDAIRKREFREDLYHRLSAYEIHIPPLRERPDDIKLLVRHFFDITKDQAKYPLKNIDDNTLRHLAALPWPGNVRELRNALLRAISLARQPVLDIKDFTTSSAGEQTQDEGPLLTLREAEKLHIARVLDNCDGNIKQTAETLRISRTTLYKKLNDYGLESSPDQNS